MYHDSQHMEEDVAYDREFLRLFRPLEGIQALPDGQP
jgi:hypothetical protein